MIGIYTALATPFTKESEIDWTAFDLLMKSQIAQGVDGVVIAGTTGESPTLTQNEKLELFARALSYQRAGFSIIAGTGSNSTRETIELSQRAEQLGCKYFLIVTPYYNKPSQAGLLAHFRAVADAVLGEIILYNVPGRTGVSLLPATIVSLARHPRITTLKEATGNMGLLAEIRSDLQSAGQNLDLLSGDDATFLQFVRGGGVGTISVASHFLAREIRLLLETATTDPAASDVLQKKCIPLFRNLFTDSNPVPLKFCLSEGGLIQNELRLPLVPLSLQHEDVLRGVLSDWSWNDGALA